MRCRYLISSLAGIAILMATAASPAEGIHLTEHTVADAGRTRVIAFSVATPPQTDRELLCEVADSDVLEIAGPATIGAGRPIGYVRVRGVRPGVTTLTVDGSPLSIEVVKPRGPERRDRYEPRIVGPVRGWASGTREDCSNAERRTVSAESYRNCRSTQKPQSRSFGSDTNDAQRYARGPRPNAIVSGSSPPSS